MYLHSYYKYDITNGYMMEELAICYSLNKIMLIQISEHETKHAKDSACEE